MLDLSYPNDICRISFQCAFPYCRPLSLRVFNFNLSILNLPIFFQCLLIRSSATDGRTRWQSITLMQRHQNNLHGLVMSTEDNYGKGLSMRNSNLRVSRAKCSTTSLITVHVSPDFCSAIGNAKIFTLPVSHRRLLLSTRSHCSDLSSSAGCDDARTHREKKKEP